MHYSKNHLRLSGILLGIWLLSACSHDNTHGIDIPCLEPVKTSVGAMKLVSVIAPSSEWQIASDLLSPKKSLSHYGFKYSTTVTMENVSGGTLYIDSLDLRVSKTDDSNPFNSSIILDSAIEFADSASTTINVVSEVRANNINATLLKDMLQNSVSDLKIKPTLFVRYSSNHICRDSERFLTDVLSDMGVYALETSADVAIWIFENPADFANIILVILSILLKAA